MTRLVSIALVYFTDVDLDMASSALERELKTEVEISEHAHMGDAGACIIDVRVPDSFSLQGVQRRMREAVPAVHVRMLERFRESRWRRYRWNVALSIGGGIAVALIVDLLRPSVARLRELFG